MQNEPPIQPTTETAAPRTVRHKSLEPRPAISNAKEAVIRAIELVNGFGFALIIGAVIYFILGSVTKLVGGHMLDWTFCGSLHYFFDANPACVPNDLTGEDGFDAFIFHLFTKVTLPWIMILIGLLLTGISSLLLNILDYKYVPPRAKKLDEEE